MDRKVHPDVLRFCRPELLQENYFHAVFEATKSVAQKIRDKTGLTGDGAEIVDRAFGVGNPLLAINTLQTETEQSEQKGFANLLKGVFGTFRNVTGHAPKIFWPISEQDALDILSIISYLHRRLDAAVRVPAT
ncbi:MAG TPA: TIGR02391 family protein [Pyrinomonadaceae bacterium]